MEQNYYHFNSEDDDEYAPDLINLELIDKYIVKSEIIKNQKSDFRDLCFRFIQYNPEIGYRELKEVLISCYSSLNENCELLEHPNSDCPSQDSSDNEEEVED